MQDQNNNGIDDRQESRGYGFNDTGTFRDYLFGPERELGDPGYGNKDVYAFDTLAYERNLEGSLGMQQAQIGAMGDVMGMAFGFQQLGDSNARSEIFDYTMRGMDKQTELQNYFANQNYNRDIGRSAAAGEQTRKNFAAEGLQNRLQTITSGEQARLGYAAQGDQERLNIAARGDEERETYDANDLINARREERARGRAKGLARSF